MIGSALEELTPSSGWNCIQRSQRGAMSALVGHLGDEVLFLTGLAAFVRVPGGGCLTRFVLVRGVRPVRIGAG
jgi:hypothetical protein